MWQYDDRCLEEIADESRIRKIVHDALGTLTPKEAKVLRMRFGIGVNRAHTLVEVGKKFDVTREFIRKIEARALRKLRQPSVSDKFIHILRDGYI